MQFLAYSVLLLRPLFAAITDKYKIKGYQRKYYMILSGYVFAVIYILMGLTLNNILLFGVFLLFIFISSTMLDVSTKSLIIDISPSDEIKKKSFFYITVGDSLGRALPYFLFLLLMNNIYSLNSWITFFMVTFTFLLPLIGILPFINEKNEKESNVLEISRRNDVKNLNNQVDYPNFKLVFILICIFVLFAFSDTIFAYPFFPYLLNKFGTLNFNFFNLFLIFYFLLSILSTAIGTFLMKRIESKKILLTLIPLIGIIYIFYTIVDFTLFIVLYVIANSLATITNLNISVYIMKFKKTNKTIYFHLIASFRNLSIFIFLPLGTLLSTFIITEYLIIIGAILLNFSLIPLILIK
ncbi:MAG: MFS transporter [Promethearchaeota archaeon]